MTRSSSLDVVTPALVRAAQGGDVAALDDILNAARSEVLHYVTGKLRTYDTGRELAQDVTQDVLLALTRALPRYVESGVPFGAFVYGITRNKVNDAQRRRYADPERLDGDGAASNWITTSAERSVMLRLEALEVLAAVDRLPEKSARLLKMKAAGYSGHEIGEAFGMSLGAVRVAAHRAASLVRADLKACAAAHPGE
jgi:RNA polymerase sigma-70 factor (ECF subfamily)